MKFPERFSFDYMILIGPSGAWLTALRIEYRLRTDFSIIFHSSLPVRAGAVQPPTNALLLYFVPIETFPNGFDRIGLRRRD